MYRTQWPQKLVDRNGVFPTGIHPPWPAGPARHDIFEDTMGMLEFDEGKSGAVRKS